MSIETLDKPDSKELRTFAVTIAIAFIALGGLILWRKGETGLISAGIGAAILISGLVWPQSLTLPYKGWMALALVLGFIMTHIILGLVYYLVLTPIGLIMRMLGKNPLRARSGPDAPSYWINRQDRKCSPARCEKMY